MAALQMASAILIARLMVGHCVKNNLVVYPVARAAMACLMICGLAGGLALSGCASNPDKDRPENPFKKAPQPGDAKAPQSDAELHAQADKLYRRAHEAVLASEWTPAGERLDKLVAAYPFSDYATQAEMEKIWVGYKGGQPDEALSDADRFLRAHPRTPQAEYVQYLKGIISFSRGESILDVIGINQSPRKDVSNERRSYDDFALLVQRYPNSKYAGDARRRMIFLRDRIAAHDLTVAQYYLRRGAFIAAALRAQNVVAEYPGAPATKQALAIMETSFRQAGLKEQADDAATILAANINNQPFVTPPPATLIAVAVVKPAPAPPPDAADTDTKATLYDRFTHLLRSLSVFNIFSTPKTE
jgi:outer membrane protein assembly factor BamD